MFPQTSDNNRHGAAGEAKDKSHLGAFVAGWLSFLGSNASARSTVLMVVMFLVGAGWVMMKSKETRVYRPDETNVEKELLVSSWLMETKKNAAAEKHLSDFRGKEFLLAIDDVRQKQIPVDELSKNPYAFLHFPEEIYPIMINQWESTKSEIGQKRESRRQVIETLMEKEQFAEANPPDGRSSKVTQAIRVNRNAMIEDLAWIQAQGDAMAQCEIEAMSKMRTLLADARNGGVLDDTKQKEGELANNLAEEEAGKKLAESVERLELQSILRGDVASAMISGQLVDEGQTVDGWAVVEIHNTEVVLQKQNQRHVLKIR